MTLKELRENAGLTQMLVAKKCFVSVNAVSQWERGINGIASKYHAKLARLYHTTDDEIRAASEMAQADSEKQN